MYVWLFSIKFQNFQNFPENFTNFRQEFLKSTSIFFEKEGGGNGSRVKIFYLGYGTIHGK